MRKKLITFIIFLALILVTLHPMTAKAETMLTYDSDTNLLTGVFQTQDTYMRIELYTTLGYLKSGSEITFSVGSSTYSLSSSGLTTKTQGDCTVLLLGTGEVKGYSMECSILQVSVPKGTAGWTIDAPVTVYLKEIIIERAEVPENSGTATVSTTAPLETIAYFINSATSNYAYSDISGIVNSEATTSKTDSSFTPTPFVPEERARDTLKPIFLLLLFLLIIGITVSCIKYIRTRKKWKKLSRLEFVKEENKKIKERKSLENEKLKRLMASELKAFDTEIEKERAKKTTVESPITENVAMATEEESKLNQKTDETIKTKEIEKPLEITNTSQKAKFLTNDSSLNLNEKFHTNTAPKVESKDYVIEKQEKEIPVQKKTPKFLMMDI